MLLSVDGLRVAIDGQSILRALSFSLDRGETLGILGESGSGKSMTALAIMGLLPSQAKAGGRIALDGQDLLDLSDEALAAIRGKRVAMIFQEPMTSLNPVHRIGDQIAEGLVLHDGVPHAAALHEAERLLARVGISEARARLRAYPHQLSGGQRQRVMIAMALACRPDVLIADEPTSALDVTVQAELIGLLRDLVVERGMALIVISHDLGVIAALAARALVLYGGTVMEEGKTRAMLENPTHPYTQGLIAATPAGRRRGRLTPIPGNIPSPAQRAPGCPFHGRCAKGDARCRAEAPPPIPTASGQAWCFHPESGR